MEVRLRYYIDLVTVLTQKEIKVRYKSSLLGYLWSVGHPLAFALVFFVAFKLVMRIQMEDYTLFLICGLFPWQWFQNSVNFSPAAFLSNASLIKKVNFPRNFIPLSVVLNDMVHFVLSIPVIVFFMIFYRRSPAFSWVAGIPLLLVLQFLITYGVSLAVASLNLFFRDLERLVTILTTLVFYFTPIIYPETMIPKHYQYLLQLNPVAPLMVTWRTLFLEGTMYWDLIALSLLYGLSAFFAGFLIYRWLCWRFAEVV